MSRLVGSHERAYRGLLRLYPAEFRARYADEMVRLFGDQLRDARSDSGAPAGAARTWFRTLADLAVTAVAEHSWNDRAVAHSLAASPSSASQALGLAGIVGGAVLVAAFLPFIPWGPNLFQIRLVLFNVGAIAIVVGVHRRQAAVSSRLSRAAAIPAALSNAWYLVMVILAIGRPQPPDPDPDFRLVMFFAGVAMWWTDAAFGLVTLRLGAVARWGALALTVGSLLAFLGMDRLGLVTGPHEAIFVPLALTGIALNGLGWILLGVNLVFRGGGLRAAQQQAEDSSRLGA